MTEATPGRSSAVALSSGPDASLMVVAKGYGEAAEQIVLRARAHGLYVHASPELVKLLMQIDLDERIPPQLYLAVGEVFSWLYQMDVDYGSGLALPDLAGREN